MPLNWKTNYARYRHYLPTGLGGLYKKKQFRAYTGFTLTLFTVSFFLFFAIRPTITTITVLVKTIEDQKKVSDTLQEKINTLSKAQEEYNSISSLLPLLEQSLPRESQTDLLTQELEVIASQSNVKIESLKFDPHLLWDFSATNSINFFMVVSGDYPLLKDFLVKSLTLRRIIKLSSFSFQEINVGEAEIDSTGKLNQQKVLSLTIKGVAYAYNSSQPVVNKKP